MLPIEKNNHKDIKCLKVSDMILSNLINRLHNDSIPLCDIVIANIIQ